MQTLRQTGKERRRARILHSAAEIAVTDGLAALTMRSLSEHARVSVPTIYHLVGGRDDVVTALLADRADEFHRALTRLPGAPIARVLAISDAWASYLVARRDLVRSVLRSGEAVRIRRSDAVTAAAAAALVEALVAGRRTHDIAVGAEPMLLARRFAGMATATIVVWADDHGDDKRLRLELRHCALVVLLAASTAPRREGLVRRLRAVERELFER